MLLLSNHLSYHFIILFVIMAHWDYHCCAVCDCKIDYAGHDARTKKDICVECLKNLRGAWINILDWEELTKYIESNDPVEVRQVLEKIWFCYCWYENPVDDAANKINLPDKKMDKLVDILTK